jgi:protein gp37
MRNTKIEWCHHTFNPWWGCTRVSPGCEHCYAEAFAKRTGHQVWGVKAPRRLFGDEHWAEPLRWDAAAAAAGERRRVFCASMADVFEDREDLEDQRARLYRLTRDTPWLDWLLLTKRPENAERLWENAQADADGFCLPSPWRANHWFGTTAEDQQRATERLPHLLAPPAAVRFVSYEPALEAVDLSRWMACPKCRGSGREPSLAFQAIGEEVETGLPCTRCLGSGQDCRPGVATHEAFGVRGQVFRGIDWMIVGGESGPEARPCDVQWIRDVVRQSKAARVPVFVKQLGSRIRWGNLGGDSGSAGQSRSAGGITHAKGGDPSEWPEDLRVREFPPAPRPS